jgi:hypothetical protein
MIESNPTTERLMTIGALARESRLSLKALRLYHELGLLRPAEVDDATGYRYYRGPDPGRKPDRAPAPAGHAARADREGARRARGR